VGDGHLNVFARVLTLLAWGILGYSEEVDAPPRDLDDK